MKTPRTICPNNTGTISPCQHGKLGANLDNVSEEHQSAFDPNRVKRAIAESSYDPAAVAEEIGKSLDLVYRWQQGSRQPRLDDLFLLARATRKPLEFFFGEDGHYLERLEMRPREALNLLGQMLDELEDNREKLSRLLVYLNGVRRAGFDVPEEIGSWVDQKLLEDASSCWERKYRKCRRVPEDFFEFCEFCPRFQSASNDVKKTEIVAEHGGDLPKRKRGDATNEPGMFSGRRDRARKQKRGDRSAGDAGTQK